MTKRTTDEWQNLLDGTTPGPWGHYVPRGADGHYDPVFGDVPGDEISLVKRPADWHLIAAAPEAVAEVIRLRKALDELAHGAYVMASQHYYMGGKRYDELGSTEQSYYEDLTRILEGDTDE